MIKYFDHQGPKVSCVLRDMKVSVFEQLGINTWEVIDRRLRLFEQVLKGSALTKYRNTVIAKNELVREEYGYQWGIGEPEYVASHDLWAFYKTDGLDCGGCEITTEDRWIKLDRDIWFMMGSPKWKNNCNVFEEHIYYFRNEIQKTFKMGILE